jgi:hypothetical protein
MCGILGAALAVLRPRPNRVTLAVVCALAGVGYGALLNFSLMATYGGDLSLQRFLALEARAVPFDAAHAIGNATLALVAGPAMVRALVRFRERFEWRAAATASVLLLALALVGALPGRAQAGTASAAAWLASVENSNGGWGSSPDSASSPSVTAWAMLGLEAAGRNPLDVSSGGKTGVDYLRAKVGSLSSPGDFARTILALKGAGVDPREFGGRNLVSALAKRRRGDGSFEGWPGTTAFAILALRSTGGGVESSVSWLAGAQNGDGGWGDDPGSPSTADGTGAAMQAIPGSDAARRGLAYLKGAQRSNGGFALGGSGGVNSQSTAWAVQGTIAVGTDPASVATGGKSPLEYLATLQQPDGHYRYSASSDQTPVWVTGQVLVAAAGDAFPVAPAPRLPKLTPQSAPPQSSGGSTHAGSAPLPGLPTIPPRTSASPDQGGAGSTAPSPGGGSTGTAPPPSQGIPSIPLPEGTPPPGEAEPATAPPPAAPPFRATAKSGPKPWAPLAAGFGSAGIALAAVLLLGRRFGW